MNHAARAKELQRYVYLKVSGSEGLSFDPESLNVSTGVLATRSWRKGDAAPGRSMPRKFDFWGLDSLIGREAQLSEQVATLFDELSRNWNRLRNAIRQYAPVLQYVVY